MGKGKLVASSSRFGFELMGKINSQLEAIACELFEMAGISNKIENITSVKRGGNNQIFLVTGDDRKLILKKYFQNPEDHRNRLNSEFEFLKIAGLRAPGEVPKAYSKSNSQLAALYEYISGDVLAHVSEVTESYVRQAGQFIAKLNTGENFTEIADLSSASEACFSIDQHIQTIDDRLGELQRSRLAQPDDAEFNQTLTQICDCWRNIKSALLQQFQQDPSLDLSLALTVDQRVLSPSDFGFHNVLIRPDARLAFIDFEYAGWDDPAKLVGDFFAQVAIPVDLKYFDLFVSAAFKHRLDYESICARSSALLPLYKIKWCCIVLNIYLPKHLARRKFANPGMNVLEIKRQQLLKAKQLLEEAIL